MDMHMEDKIRLVTGRGSWHTAATPSGPEEIHLSDGPHGLRKQDDSTKTNNDSVFATCFPTASAIAASFDVQAASDMGAAIAKEALAEQVGVLLGPGVNIKRSPMCGRNFEYYSEDPCLAGLLGTAFVQAVQKEGVGTSLKHFAGNSQETHRMTSNSEIDERALREIYLAAFETVVREASPATIMASYNRLNGEYACQNKHLLTEILREEWGYEGAVISDWGACSDLPASIAAGMDLEMPDNSRNHLAVLKQALDDGLLAPAYLDRAVNNITRLIEQYGPSSRGSRTMDSVGSKTQILNDNHAIAERLAAETAVLLKNEGGILPLNTSDHYLVIGDLAKNMRYQGGGSSHIHVIKEPDAVRVMNSSGMDITYCPGYESRSFKINSKLQKEALQAVQNTSDPILFFGGLTQWAEGEGYDRKDLNLPMPQIALLKEIRSILETKPEGRRNPLIYLSFGGSPYDMTPALFADAIIHMYPAGESMDCALVRILTGKCAPSGHLPETWPKRVEDIPCYETWATGSDDVEYRESIFVGYRYYDTYNIEPLFPFGYGLSYTTFEYSDLKLSGDTYDGTGTLRALVTVTNTGNCDGAEVVQLYVKAPAARYLRASRELRGFTRVFLKAGESTTISFELGERHFSLYDTITSAFVMPSGGYEIQVGSSLTDIRLCAPVEIEGVSYLVDDRIRLSEYFLPMHEYVNDKPAPFHITREQFAKLYKNPLSDFDSEGPGKLNMCTSINKLARYSMRGRMLKMMVKIAARFMLKGVRKEDPEYRMFLEGAMDGTLDAVVSMSGGALSYERIQKLIESVNRK